MALVGNKHKYRNIQEKIPGDLSGNDMASDVRMPVLRKIMSSKSSKQQGHSNYVEIIQNY